MSAADNFQSSNLYKVSHIRIASALGQKNMGGALLNVA
jgi:hypothetical protein